MLTTMKLTGNAQNLSIYHTQEENYYFKQSIEFQNIVMPTKGGDSLDYVRVHGRLCEIMGFKDGQSITRENLEGLLGGKNSNGIKMGREHRVMAIDLTFSAPKTVSVAGLVIEHSLQITKAHDGAVLDTLREIEKHHTYARPTSTTKFQTDKMIYVMVRDGFSREHDPHLHTHAILMNLTEYEGKVMSIDGKEIMSQDFNRLWGMYYRLNLASRMKELGYSITYTKNGEWRLNKISRDIEREFSTRRQQIVNAKTDGKRDMDAWRKTRADKAPQIDKTKIIQGWENRLSKYQTKTNQQIRLETLKEREDWITQAEFSIEAQQEREGLRENTTEEQRWQLALERATQKTATATEEAIIAEYLAERMRANDLEKISFQIVRDRFSEQVKQGFILEVDKRYTSIDFAITERDYFNKASEKNAKYVLDRKEAESAIKNFELSQKQNNRQSLSESQRDAAIKILNNDDYLCVVQGDAGAGKTTMLKAVAEAYKERGYKVKGLAMQGVAARNLQKETGIESATVKSFLNTKTSEAVIIILDEASMLDSRSAMKLFQKASRDGSKIILVGDRNQLESIQAGRVFDRLVCEAADKQKLINLNENFRQRDEELKKAVLYARDGKMKESLEIIDNKQCIKEIEDAHERRKEVAKLYNKNTLIVTSTVAAREELNQLIRDDLFANDGIDKEQKTYKVVRTDESGIEHEKELSFSKGEMVTFLKNEYKDYDIRNGERAKIIRLKDNSLGIELEDGRKIDLNLENYRNIDYGYALTTYKAQGQTYDKVIVESDTRVRSLLDMRNQYVNVTRARDSIQIFTDNKEDLFELAQVKTFKADTLDSDFDREKLTKVREQLNEITQRKYHEEAMARLSRAKETLQQSQELNKTKRKTFERE